MDTRYMIIMFNGLTQGALFFILGSGLTLAFGVMRIVNMSHGAFYLLGGYLGFSVLLYTGSWTLAVLSGGLFIALLGLALERGLLKRIQAGGDLSQTLLTIAFSMIIADLCLATWGGHPLSIKAPAALSGPVKMFGFLYPGFRYVLMLTAVVIAFGLWFLLFRTRLGMAARASVDDRETVSALGIRIDTIYSLMFMLSAFLGGVAGVLGGSYLQLSPGEDITILTYSLVVVIVGGLGSLLGTLISALVLGQILSFSLAFVPEMSMFLVFAPMALMLAIRPQGLFGRRF